MNDTLVIKHDIIHDMQSGEETHEWYVKGEDKKYSQCEVEELVINDDSKLKGVMKNEQ